MRVGVYFLAFLASLYLQASDDVLDLAAKYNEQKNQVVDLEEKRRKTLSDIYAIEKKTNKIVLKKGELDQERLKLDNEMKKLSQKIVSIESKIYDMTPMLIERLAVVEQMNNLPWFYTLLTSENLAELDQIFKSAKKINEKQAELVVNFLKLVNDLKAKKLKLQDTAKSLLAVKKDIENQEQEISKNQESKKQFLSRLERVLKNEKHKLKRIKGEGRRKIIEADLQELALLFGTDFFDKKGELPHPIKAPLVQSYGLNQGLKEDYVQLLHKGYFYQSSEEKRPRSVSGGRVKFSGPVKGFGQVVILDHGGRYYSTYGYLAKTNLKINDIVKKGQEIGELGYESLQFGKGLYFEIRHFSQPQDPKDWLKDEPSSLATL
jgi:septal ring factor EnvC (AmiA/AmiB activator)